MGDTDYVVRNSHVHEHQSEIPIIERKPPYQKERASVEKFSKDMVILIPMAT